VLRHEWHTEENAMLKITEIAIECCADVGRIAQMVSKYDRSLADQMRRAMASVALNAPEGCGVSGGNSRLRFRTALGSAREVETALRVARAFGYVSAIDEALLERLDRIRATLWKLAR
jgi:four helix bundle protein